MDAALKTQHDTYEKEIAKLKRELSAVRRQVVDVREKWGQAFKDVIKEPDIMLLFSASAHQCYA